VRLGGTLGKAACALVVVLSIAALTGCGGHAQTAAAPSSEPSAAATAAPEIAASAATPAVASAAPDQSAASASPAGTPTPQPTPTPDTNLLSWKNGAVVRAYPTAAASNVNSIVERGIDYPSDSKGPFVFDFELPAAAAITAFSADLPAAAPSASPATVTFAVSTNGAQGDYKEAGTLTASADRGVQSLPVSVTARWVRVTSAGAPFNAVAAAGTLPPLPAGVSPAGVYVELDSNPARNGSFSSVTTDTDPWYRRVTTFGSGMTAVRCYNGHGGDAYPGDVDGRVWNFKDADAIGRAVINDDASMIVGDDGGSPFYLLRSNQQPKWCQTFNSGSGPHHVLVLDGPSVVDLWPITNNNLPGYSYERMYGGMLDAAALEGKETVVLNNVCFSSRVFGKGQADGLLRWVAAGHKLLIYDADSCNKSGYDFLPYPFTTSNPGAHGASGKRLIVVESDALGSTDKSDAAHYFDPQPWAMLSSNQLGDANIVTTEDPHWCGHLFGTNALNANGFMQMYAPYGSGEFVYGGFDSDDNNVPGSQRIRTLEFGLPVPNDLPCTQKVAGGFVIQPNQEGTFTAGKAQTQTYAMELLANLAWKGHVNVATTGDFPATVTPASFDVSGGTQALSVAVSIPESAKPGAYTVTVTGDGGGGLTAQASITFTGTAPLKKTIIAKHQRIRIYGIHFDYDSAHIQPRSEPVIADIAALMRDNPTWRFEVSGHTDSDGGAAYNLGLSQRRAQSVVNDLVTRYHIARSRLVAKGYGLSRPVATNATEAGKALNRRVELERL
jgi:outer membrane protein OmpA-like peptidoglycan-associated protein